jgi:hypothetical protein
MSEQASKSGMSEEDAIKVLSKIASESSSTLAADTGACVYTAGSKTYCAVLSESNCKKLKGVWTSGGKCP